MRPPASRAAAEFLAPAPKLTPAQAEEAASRVFGVEGTASPLASERDQNFRISVPQGSFVLKVANEAEDPQVTEMQVEALLHLEAVDPTLPAPRVRRSRDGALVATFAPPGAREHRFRMVTFLDGHTMLPPAFDPPSLFDLGACAARLGRALRGFFHPAAGRAIVWDLTRTGELAGWIDEMDLPARRRETLRPIVVDFADRVGTRLRGLRSQVIHNDVHSDNVVMGAGTPARVVGVIDFGDLVHAPLVCDLAVTMASMLGGRDDPFAAAGAILRGYESVSPLEDHERDILPELVSARLALWVLISAWRGRHHPENQAYIAAFVEETWQVLEQFHALGKAEVHRRLLGDGRSVPDDEILPRRERVLGKSQMLSYDRPLRVSRGEGVWLLDKDGRRYLDAYNNVPVVGHCHPRVVEALTHQARTLNANSRYLHEAVVELAEHLVATMPPGLDTCFFVNSGSEANDLAWRIARAATSSRGAIVSAHAYHGVTVASSELSSMDWPGGQSPGSVATIRAPDGFRGPFSYQVAGWEGLYAADIDTAAAALSETGCGTAMCCLDSSFASEGILLPRATYLQEVVARIRRVGGLFVADEVQAGFGRTGRFWSFETAGVSPDLVTLGKPMGNGHPIGAVVTRSEIARAFAKACPEFFSTFGGNTVAAQVGLSVLKIIAEEGILENARDVGGYLLAGLTGLAGRCAWIGEVRGMGLMIGVELVRSPESLEPATRETRLLVNSLRERGVLVGSCGRHENVLKIRPPLVFSRSHADLLLETLSEACGALGE